MTITTEKPYRDLSEHEQQILFRKWVGQAAGHRIIWKEEDHTYVPTSWRCYITEVPASWAVDVATGSPTTGMGVEVAEGGDLIDMVEFQPGLDLRGNLDVYSFAVVPDEVADCHFVPGHVSWTWFGDWLAERGFRTN